MCACVLVSLFGFRLLADRYLGCYTHKFQAKITEFSALLGTLPAQWSRKTADGEKRAVVEPWKPADPQKVVDGICYDMSQYEKANVINKYCSIAGIDSKSLKFAATPFLDETKDEKGMYETDAPAASRQSKPSGAVPGHWYVDLQNEELPPPRLPKASVNK